MNEAQAHEAIIQRWEAGWVALHPTVLWTPMNEILDAAAEWVRVTIAPALSRQASVGAMTRWSRSGTIGIGIFSAANAGTKRASQFADDVRSVLEGQAIVSEDDIRGEPVVTLGGSSGTPTSDGAWLYTLVTIPYAFIETKGEVNVARNQQVFRYTATGAEALTFTINLPAPRASNAYRVDVSKADVAFMMDFAVPIATRTTSTFVLECGAQLSSGDVLEFTVEDLT